MKARQTFKLTHQSGFELTFMVGCKLTLLLILSNFAYFFVLDVDFLFEINFFQENFAGNKVPLERQTDCIVFNLEFFSSCR